MLLYRLLLAPLTCAAFTLAAQTVDFSGTWVFNPAKGQNLGMMAQMGMTLNLSQTQNELIEKIDATMMGQRQVQEVRLKLDGKPAANENYMGEKSTTVTNWDGPKLVTTWTTPGALAGSTHVSIETFSLSENGRTLTARTSRAGKPDVVMVYDKK
jgi:hypothetical protein